MSGNKLIFEKVSDINYDYPYLCIYDGIDKLNPFMEISITSEKKVAFTIYQNKRNVSLSVNDWQIIKENADKFLQQELMMN